MARAVLASGFLALTFALCVHAEAGDDLANNLFSDLAPLLALFGERVTMQYLSQSTSWADNIILAMAPVGIITVIVSAIRVGGPSWLKAIIGRARENRAVYEAELMSSTSDEVSELWNGTEVVRVAGKGPLRVFICLYSKAEPGETTETTTAHDLEDVIETLLEKQESGILGQMGSPRRILAAVSSWATTRRKGSSTDEESPGGDAGHGKKPDHGVDLEGTNLRIVGETCRESPNVLLNLGGQENKGEVWLAALGGTFLQLGVLLYGGFLTYHPSLMLLKDGLPVDGYAYPCMAAGTLILTCGMLLCAHVVEASTDEEIYRPKNATTSRIMWIQRAGVVAEQSFDSFALFSNLKTPQTLYIRSRRKMAAPGASLNVQAVVVTGITLVGFVVQFVGLRGMNWTASIAQLAAVLIMVCVRAWIRRVLASPPRTIPLNRGFELDWLAHELTRPLPHLWDENHKEKRPLGDFDWRVETGTDRSRMIEKDNHRHKRWRKKANNSHSDQLAALPLLNEVLPRVVSSAQKIMKIRRDLGELSAWSGPSSKEAVSLAHAIETTMNAFWPDDEGTRFWSLRTHVGDVITFRITKENGTWKACADELDAALSLWLFSTVDKEKSKLQQDDNAPRGLSGSDKWLRRQSASSRPSLKLLASCTEAAQRDFRWWMPHAEENVIRVKHCPELELQHPDDILELEPHRVVGASHLSHIHSTTTTVNWIRRHGSGLGFRSPKEEGRSEDIFASVSYQPLALLYAQDMLSAFMWAATKNMEDRIPGVVELNYGATLDPDDFFGWKNFTLRDANISKLAEDLQNTGIGSLEECYEVIIPPLSVKERLPLPHGIVELARRQAEAIEKLGNWDRIPDIYIWLFETATSYPPGPLGDMATALILEYMHYAESVLKSMVDQLYDEHESERQSVTSARYNLQEALELRIKETSSSADYYRLLISDLLSLRREHGYCWDELVKDDGLNSIQQSAITDNLDWDELGSKYGHTPVLSVHETLPSVVNGKYTLGDYTKHVDDSGCTWLHYRVHQEDSWELPYNFGRKAELEAPDLLGRTPLHHACKIGMTKAVLMLLRAGAKTDAQARDGTMPLHLAAINGHSDAVAALLEAGASRDPVDASGKTPLLWAALNGHDGVIRLLLLSGANKRARDHVGRTAAHLYALSGKTEFLGTLLEAVDYASKDPDGETPLHLAATKGHAHTIHLFFPKNRSTAAVDELGRAMCVAAQWGHGKVVSELVEVANRMGFALGFRDEYGPKALYEAGEHGRMDIIKILVDGMGVDVNTHGQEGRTLLHLLAIGGHSEAIKILLQREGIILDAKDEHGNTPLDLAERNRHSEVASLLSAAINGAVPE